MNFDANLVRSLRQLAADAAPKTVAVTENELKSAAERMARVGYDFSRTPNAQKALRLYLEGKSLCLAGTVGTGKTLFFDSLQKSDISPTLRIFPLSAHRNAYVSTICEALQDFTQQEVVIDDFGVESNWGGKRADDILAQIIDVRGLSPKRTHLTTNLSGAEIKARYDDRVISRLRQFAFVSMVGEDNRTVTINAQAAAFRAACADTGNWQLCEERCSRYVEGRCAEGKTVPPFLEGRTPEDICKVGELIPYREEHLHAEAQELAEHYARCKKQGLPWGHLAERADRLRSKLAAVGLSADCLSDIPAKPRENALQAV